MLTSEQQTDVYTVSRFNTTVRLLLEKNFTSVWVEGEISNFSAPHSGHWYFSLKDATAQVRCAMFRANQRRLGFTPKDGMHVLIKARVSLYENRGDFQLIAESMEERGEGKLRREFEILKKKLEAAGLFDQAHKKLLPTFPKCIGVITSATGAAIRDILTVLKRRYSCASVVIYPSLVQGDKAAAHIAAAIQAANRRNECDVLIVARGGGSLEDLWPFNEEVVAHAIFNSQLPIVSGVGHEVDFTIADFVADLRAPTPSAAAELVTPDKLELIEVLHRQNMQLSQLFQRQIAHVKQQLIWIHKHLQQQHPKRQLMEKMQRLDFCELTLTQLQKQLLQALQAKINELWQKLQRVSPLLKTKSYQAHLQLLQQQLKNLIQVKTTHDRNRLAQSAAQLDALSPLATLNRGYAIVLDEKQKLIRDAKQVRIGDAISVGLLSGTLHCRVEAQEEKQ